MENCEMKSHIRISSPGWEDNTKINHETIVWQMTDWINMAQDGKEWWGFVKALTDLRSCTRSEIYSLDEQLLASHKGLCCMKLAT
jgi:hypothetical protein